MVGFVGSLLSVIFFGYFTFLGDITIDESSISSLVSRVLFKEFKRLTFKGETLRSLRFTYSQCLKYFSKISFLLVFSSDSFL